MRGVVPHLVAKCRAAARPFLPGNAPSQALLNLRIVGAGSASDLYFWCHVLQVVERHENRRTTSAPMNRTEVCVTRVGIARRGRRPENLAGQQHARRFAADLAAADLVGGYRERPGR